MIKTIKWKYLLSFVVFLIATLSTSVLTITSVKAATIYDDAMKVRQGALTVRNNADQNWQTPFEFGEWLGNSPQTTSFCSNQEYRDLIINGITQGYPYAVVQQFYQGNGALVYVYVDTDNSGVQTYWTENEVSTDGFDHYMLIYQKTPYDFNCGVTTGAQISNNLSTSNNNHVETWLVNYDLEYPTGYEGEQPITESNKNIVYPTMSVIIQDNGDTDDTSKVKLVLLDDWISKNNLPSPNYVIFTLTDMNDNIIVPDRCWGPTGCDWNNLPLGDYKARLNVVYTDPTINEDNEFKTTEVWLQVNNTSYTMLLNPKENKYCTVKDGYQWNCTIPQPGDEPELITGEPEEWVQEECTKEAFPWIDLGACIRNGLHYLGEYLGINGPSITAGASPFFQFDTNTFGLTSILTAPISILNNLAGAQYTCTPVSLPLPYMQDDLQLPCMNSYYSTYLGDLYTLWQTVINGIVSYFVIVGILRMVKDAKDPQKDKIEVLAL